MTSTLAAARPSHLEPLQPPTLASRPPSVLQGVPARRCSHGHPNDPEVDRCLTCGETIDLDAPVEDVRPTPVARLVIDDGTALDLDADLVVGRAPDGRSPQLTVEGPQVSRSHLLLSARGWRLMVRDLGSTNGTFLQRLGARGRRRVPEDRSIPVAVGDHLHFGGRRATVVPYPGSNDLGASELDSNSLGSSDLELGYLGPPSAAAD
jgi:hypothetical protein